MKNDRLSFSHQQQAFNACLLNSVPSLSGPVMQYFIDQSDRLQGFMNELSLLFWKDCWHYYFEHSWAKVLDFSFMGKNEKPQKYNCLVIIPDFISLNSLYLKMRNKGIVAIGTSLLNLNELYDGHELPGLFFTEDRRKKESYVLLYKNFLSKQYTDHSPSEIIEIHEQLYNETMDLLEVLLWCDFLDVMYNSNFKNSFLPKFFVGKK